MTNTELRSRLLGVTALASEYCVTLENAAEAERTDFIASMLQLLPKIYLEFNDIRPENLSDTDSEENEGDGSGAESGNEYEDEYGAHRYYGSYVDEDYYESVRRHVESLLGPDDVYLETFEEDMKYSDTPIAASVAESLADIFQPLYNFISIVKDTEGAEIEGAYRECHDNFAAYWSQTLCNVLRALNNLYYNSSFASES